MTVNYDTAEVAEIEAQMDAAQIKSPNTHWITIHDLNRNLIASGEFDTAQMWWPQASGELYRKAKKLRTRQVAQTSNPIGPGKAGEWGKWMVQFGNAKNGGQAVSLSSSYYVEIGRL